MKLSIETNASQKSTFTTKNGENWSNLNLSYVLLDKEILQLAKLIYEELICLNFIKNFSSWNFSILKVLPNKTRLNI